MKTLLSSLALSVMLAGCTATPTGRNWVRSEVYFGLSRPDGSLITASEWQSFMSDVVTPRFPAGLSVVESTGQWRNSTGRIESEPSKMLVLLHPVSAGTESLIDEIRASYCRRFNQEAVLKVTTKVRVAF